MKIVLVGPLPPQRGGIAHSNEVLLENLAKKHGVLPISFSRIIPKIVYPGKGQRTGKGRTAAQLEIDSINPASWAEARSRIRDFSPDAVIFQWWTTVLAPCYWFLASGTRARKIAVCQNVFPHSEGPAKAFTEATNKALTRFFLSRMDRLVAMSKSDRETLKKEFPAKETGLYLEPPYAIKGLDTGTTSREEAKRMLGLENRNTMLFFGFVREYKGLQYLLEAMPEIVEATKAKLLVVGEFWEGRERYMQQIQKLGISKSVEVVDSYVPDSEVPKYFLAADLLVLPYTEISESGVIRMAFNFNTPVLATDVGGNPDHISDGINGFLVESRNSSQLAAKAIGFFTKKLYKKLSGGMKEKKRELEWSAEKEKSVLG